MELPCYVLSDTRRVLSGRGLQESLKLVDAIADGQTSGSRIARLLSNKSLNPFIHEHLSVGHFDPIICYDGDAKINGYSAEVLTDLCDALLEARSNGSIKTPRMVIVANQAEILMRAFARVGIIALVDEATGYQDSRDKDALAKILEKFVAKELQAWVKTFPIEYYKELCRLYGVQFPPKSNNQFPQFFGHVTNNTIYSRLAPELLPELKKGVSKLERKAKLHQFLTSDVGHPKLREHLASIVTILKLSQNKEQFIEMVDRIHPKFNENYALDFDES